MTSPHVSIPTVPPRYRQCRLDNYSPRTARQREALQKLRHAVSPASDDADPHLYVGGPIILCGPAGTGKTHLAVAGLYQSAISDDPEDWPSLVFANYPELALEWADRRSHGDMGALVDAWVLLIDDLMPPKSAAEADALHLLVDRRYRTAGMRMIVTTNMTPVEMRQALGDRTFDRLRHDALMLPVDGTSYRAGRQDRARAVGSNL